MIYVNKAKYSMAKKSIDIIINAEKPAEQDMSVSYSFAGEAQEDVDFKVSAPEFVFKKGETVAKITLDRIKENIEAYSKELIINLRAVPKEYALGLMNYSVVTLFGTNGNIMTFSSDNDILTLESHYAINLETMKGFRYKVVEDTKFYVEVDPSSTAIEGEHFEFTNGKYALIKARKHTGDVTIKFLKKEEGKDKIVLKLQPKDGFAIGAFASTTLQIKGASDLSGKWYFDKFVNYENISSQYGWATDVSKIPHPDIEDMIEFVGDSYKEYKVTTDFKSDYKNYFGNQTTDVKFIEEVDTSYPEEMIKGPVSHRVSEYLFPNINVNFSATHKKMRDAKVRFRTIQIDGEDVLECSIVDFEPTDFLTEVYEYDCLEFTPLRLYFRHTKRQLSPASSANSTPASSAPTSSATNS